ncbi:MAG TPA: xanthine dehydrogenase family protein molybdopterin-binding subunit [Xanthobacteraceae bacterium]|jgi:carbon-monoxide dehydrogenase large subunit
MPRFEDLRLVRGAGGYTDDVSVDGQSYGVFVRSPHAHAHIISIDTAAARSMPGVLAVLTGEDYFADGHVGLSHFPNPADAIDVRLPSFQPAPDRKVLDEPQLPLAGGRVRYVGEAVAMVVADTLMQARDAAEAVEVEYDVLPAVTDVTAALVDGAPALSPGARANVALDQEFGSRPEVEAAMERAHLVIAHTIRNQRTASAFLEPRSAIGSWDPGEERYTLISGCQGVHRIRHPLALCLNVPPERVRVICPDVGGAFGSRTNLYPEQVAVSWAARHLGRPVKWTADRSEAFLTDYTARDVVTTARLAFDRRGRMLALALELTANIGAHTVSYVPLSNGYRVAPTVYDVPLACVRLRGVMTNTVPTAPFRGAGRPEATAVMERLIDLAAKRLGLDRVDLRRRNLISRDKLPHCTATGLIYDSGDFRGNLARVLELADWSGFAARRRQAGKRGRLRGIGVANYVETPVGMPHERVRLRVMNGRVDLIVGTQSSGQGHETSFRQVVADALGVEPELVNFVGGDSAALASGGGTHSDRSMRLAGSLMLQTAKSVMEKARRAAAILLEAQECDIVFADGLYAAPNSNRRLTLFDVAGAMDNSPEPPEDLRGPLAAEATCTGRIPAYPTGAAVCEVEADPETGMIDICRYGSVDDGGQPINPLILHGQVHGGVAQGMGQAMLEQAVYERASGQLLSASFLDYSMPRADHFPFFDVELTEDPTTGNALRVKGGGEAGITPSPAAFINAVMDALADLGIEHLDMPATPERVWAAIRAARRGQS